MAKETAATKLERLVDEEVDESFPASDPPSFSGTHAGAPCPATDEDDALGESDKTECGVREPHATEDRG